MEMAVHILKRCIYDHIKTTNNLDKPNHQKKRVEIMKIILRESDHRGTSVRHPRY